MRLTRVGVNILKSEVEALEKQLPKFYKAVDDWVADQESRDGGYGVDQYWIAVHRDTLENQIDDLRMRISKVYDEMGDRGMIYK